MRATVSVIAIALAIALSSSPPDQAVAGHAGKDCGIISKGSQDYRARALKMDCKLARRSSLRYLGSQQARRGFDCGPTEQGFYCKKGRRAYWATRL